MTEYMKQLEESINKQKAEENEKKALLENLEASKKIQIEEESQEKVEKKTRKTKTQNNKTPEKRVFENELALLEQLSDLRKDYNLILSKFISLDERISKSENKTSKTVTLATFTHFLRIKYGISANLSYTEMRNEKNLPESMSKDEKLALNGLMRYQNHFTQYISWIEECRNTE